MIVRYVLLTEQIIITQAAVFGTPPNQFWTPLMQGQEMRSAWRRSLIYLPASERAESQSASKLHKSRA